METVYRGLKKSDYHAIADMVRQTWEFDKACPPDLAALAGKMYLRVCLSEQNFALVAEQEGKVIGFLMGRGGKLPMSAHFHGVLLFPIIAAFKRSKEGRKIWGLFNTFFTINKELLEKSNQSYDGELVLFIVDKNAKGKGVGKELLTRFHQFMRSVSAKNYYLFTDSYCDFGFYDRQGFRRAGEKPTDLALHEGRRMDFFMYEYTI